MRQALPGGALEPLRGFRSAEPGLGTRAGGWVPTAGGWGGQVHRGGGLRWGDWLTGGVASYF